jgi:hypothetical protein
VPTHYVLDRGGKVVDAWCDKDEARMSRVLENLAVR